ncbi:hypothetical protein WA158_005242 [Blastocystis sp. Blastoise]
MNYDSESIKYLEECGYAVKYFMKSSTKPKQEIAPHKPNLPSISIYDDLDISLNNGLSWNMNDDSVPLEYKTNMSQNGTSNQYIDIPMTPEEEEEARKLEEIAKRAESRHQIKNDTIENQKDNKNIEKKTEHSQTEEKQFDINDNNDNSSSLHNKVAHELGLQCTCPVCCPLVGNETDVYCQLCKMKVPPKEWMDHIYSISHQYNQNQNIHVSPIEISSTNKGYQLLEKLGWNKDKGLGKEGEGRMEPVPTRLKLNRLGVGSQFEAPLRVTHFPAYNEQEVLRKGYCQAEVMQYGKNTVEHSKIMKKLQKEKEQKEQRKRIQRENWLKDEFRQWK